MVRGEIREIEENISHPRILPIKDPDTAVIEKIGIHEIIVTRSRCEAVLQIRVFQRTHRFLKAIKTGGKGNAEVPGDFRICLNRPKGRELARDGLERVNLTECNGHTLDVLGTSNFL